MAPRAQVSGHCLCGTVRFTAAVRTRETHCCHCEMCRRWTGSALLAVSIAPDDIVFDGAETIRTYASSDWAERAWCDRCGSTLYYRLSVDGFGPRTYEMSLGLFDDPGAFPMAKEIFIDRKPTAYAFAGDHRRLTEAEHLAARGLA
ncbi:GFA family protein [uncultured Amaricoccus sp.]|uniref:GFA family protein n=1 Tax=uncultured Amaricoccus sp. TaxID=339341 RepID=UPI0026290135|nr:GFA family protein [uncultured Amaricoccus sp.]